MNLLQVQVQQHAQRREGCCFSIGYGDMMAPCCLTIISKEMDDKACKDKKKELGGAVGWAQSCPANNQEADKIIKDVNNVSAVQMETRQHRSQLNSLKGKEQCSLHELPVSHKEVASFASFDQGSTYAGLYANKGAKFAMCLIEKNACSAWSTILNKLHRHSLDAGYVTSIVQETFSPETATDVFKDPSATRAVFVRDPLERFLSAFLDKCLSGPCSGLADYCFMRKPEQKGGGIPFSQAVQWILLQNTSHIDGHWSLQSHHCELHSRLHEYTILGIMGKRTLAKNAACLLERAGLSYLNVKSSAPHSPAFWQVPEDAGYSSAEQTTEYLKSFYSKEAAQNVYNAFKEDYELFKLPRPDWIDHANGNFYSLMPADNCDPPSLVQSDVKSKDSVLSARSDDIDEIPILARRAGFVL